MLSGSLVIKGCLGPKDGSLPEQTVSIFKQEQGEVLFGAMESYLGPIRVSQPMQLYDLSLSPLSPCIVD